MPAYPTRAQSHAGWIIQHPRERFHPIGTARILDLGLSKVHVSVCYRAGAEPPAGLPEGAALLYPGRSDQALPSLRELPETARPSALVVLDGTWAHTHTLYRDNRWLHALPRFALSPTAQSRYRIRREPAAHCISTVEAVVEALSLLEPDNHALQGLLGAFENMIDDQIRLRAERPSVTRRPKKKRVKRPTIPSILIEEAERLVLVYGESRADCRDPSRPRQLVQWCALRPATGETFDKVLRVDLRSLVPRHLEHMLLSPGELEKGVSLQAFGAAWRAFCAEGDILLSWNPRSLKLLREHVAVPEEHLQLKTAYSNWRRRRSGTLESVLQREGLMPLPVPVRGRARLRLGNVAALLTHMQSIAMTTA